jgi:hypothetical protein
LAGVVMVGALSCRRWPASGGTDAQTLLDLDGAMAAALVEHAWMEVNQ